MRTRSIVLLALALGCGLIAAIGINQVMANRKPEEKASGDTKPIFVAVTDIAPGDMITPKSVKLEEWPVGKIPKDALSEVKQIDDRRAKTKLFAGDVLRDTKLWKKGETGHLATELIPAGYRVVPVETDEVAGGGGLIRPGDRVDVLVHLEKNPRKGIENTTTQTILQDIKVFAVGDVYKVDPESSDEQSLTAKTISLLVTPEQAQKLTMASELGHIRLTLRSHSDSLQTELDPTSPGFMHSIAHGASRPDDSLFKSETKPDPNAGKSGLLSFLNQLATESKKKPPAQPAPSPLEPPEAQQWSVRVLSGDAVADVRMERTGPAGGHWITVTAAPEAVVPAEPAPPVAEPPATEGLDSESQDPIDQKKSSQDGESNSSDSDY